VTDKEGEKKEGGRRSRRRTKGCRREREKKNAGRMGDELKVRQASLG
jgi:hypothetical protein